MRSLLTEHVSQSVLVSKDTLVNNILLYILITIQVMVGIPEREFVNVPKPRRHVENILDRGPG